MFAMGTTERMRGWVSAAPGQHNEHVGVVLWAVGRQAAQRVRRVALDGQRAVAHAVAVAAHSHVPAAAANAVPVRC